MTRARFVRWAVPLMLLLPWSLVLGAIIALLGTAFGIFWWPVEGP